MPGTVNYASKYSKKVDEAFYRESFCQIATNKEFDWTGVNTVNVYSMGVAQMNDYNMEGGMQRYGVPTELTNATQEMTLAKDRSFTFTIDRRNREDTMMTMDSGKALARQIRLVCIPERDQYVFRKMSEIACANEGHYSEVAADAKNAYSQFLNAKEVMGDSMVPDEGLICISSYKFANFLKQDPAFVKYGDSSQAMVKKGIIGTVDGTIIRQVPKSRLPEGCSFILCHPMATVAPVKIQDYKIHVDPPGVNGWLCEGRWYYDAFVLNNKKNAIFYQGTKVNPLVTAAVQSTKGK